MSKLGFTKKELSDGLAAEGIAVKSGTLNRYLTEYQDAKKEPEKSQADLETCKAEIVTEKTGLENPKSCWKNPKSDGHAAGEKSDSPPEDQGVSHAGK
jgi:arginine repressor